MDLFIRVTTSYDSLADLFPTITCDKLVVYEHDTARKHVHFYIVNSAIKPDAIKTRIKKHLHVTTWDKNNWSFKTATDSNCITYMSKGKLEPSFVKGFTQEEIIGYKDRWVERTPETSLPKKSTGPTQYDMSMEVFDMASKKLCSTTLDSLFSTDDYLAQVSERDLYECLCSCAIKVCHKYRKGFDEYSIRKVITPAYTKFTKGKAHIVDKLMCNFFRS